MTSHYKKLSDKKLKLVDKDSGYSKRITVKEYQLPNGLVESYFIDNDKDSVQVFAITTDNQVVCVRQFRPGTESEELEIPGGGLEPGEDPKSAAERELLEETGHQSSEGFVFLSSVPYSPYSSGKRYSYLAVNCKPTSEQNLDPNEFVKITILPLDDFKVLMSQGKVRGFEAAYIALHKLGNL